MFSTRPARPCALYARTLPVLLASLSFIPAANATSVFWNGIGTTWNSTADWYTAASGSTTTPGNIPNANDTATFNTSNLTTAQSINLDLNQAISSLTFNSTGNVTINTGVGTNTLSIGSGGITANASSGVDTINAAIALAASQQWNNNSANALTIANLSLGAANLTVAGTGTTSINGVVSGTGGLTKIANGTLSLGGANTYSGVTTINAGTLKLLSATAFGSSANVTLASGATIDLNGTTSAGRPANLLTGSILVNNNANAANYSGAINNGVGYPAYNFSVGGIGNVTLGTIGGASIVTKNASNTLTLSGTLDNNSIGLVANAGTVLLAKTSSSSVHAVGSGNVIINNAATVQLGGTGGDQLWDGATVAVNNTATFDTNGQSETFSSLTLNGGTLANNASGSNSTVTANVTLAADASTSIAYNSSLVVNGVISGNHNLTLNGNGYSTLLLNGNNTFTGNVRLGLGATLTLGNGNALTANNTLSQDTSAGYYGSVLNINGQNVVISGLSGGSSGYYGTFLQNNAAASGILTVKNNANNEFDGNISDGNAGGNLHFIKDGPASLTLGGNNTFSGGWEAYNGTLVLASDSALGSSGDGGLYAGATLDLNGHPVVSGSITGGGNITNSSTTPAAVSSVFNNGFVPVAGAGNITFSGALLYCTFTINSNATVAFSGPDDNLTTNAVLNSGTLLLAKTSDAFHHAIGTGVTINGGTLLLGGTGGEQIYDGANVSLAAGAFDANGRSETFNALTLSGAGVANTGALLNSAPANSTLTIPAGIALTANASIGVSQPDASLTLNAPISGNFAITKVGQGTLILTAPNSFTGNLTIANGSLLLSGGSIPGNVINNAAFIYNSGAVAGRLFNAGTVTLNADLALGNGLENDGNFQLAPGRTLTLNGAGLDNEAAFSMTGGTLTLPAGGAASNINRGTFSLAAPLNLGPANLTNAGAFVLANAILSGSGQFTNATGALLSGSGTITAPLANAGTIAPTGGILSLPAFTNTGTIEMSAATASLLGGAITNNATIEGFGRISNPITNAGTIEATGGNLVIAGALINNGILRTTAATKLLLQNNALPNNAGLIDLAGGTFDNGGSPLANNGQITGFGVLSTGGLTNNAAITFTGGTSTINGNVTNNAGKTINIKYQPALFTGNITNNGTIKTTSTTVTFTGNYSGNQYISDPATNIFQQNATTLSGGLMTGSAGDVFSFNTFTNNGTFTNGGNLSVSTSITNNGTFSQTGPQSWATGATFTNTAGTATFASNAKLSALTISAGTVDLTTSKFIIEATNKSATLATLQQNIAARSLIATNIPANYALALIDNAITNLASFGGNPADSNSLLLAPELLGDTNIDGTVNALDLQTVLNHFGQQSPNWTDGNFDHTATINLTDLAYVLNNFNQSIPNPSTPDSGLKTQDFIPTPEPASLALLTLGAAALLTRRRI